MFASAIEYPIRCLKPFERLPELAYNLWWSWNPEAQSLFEQIDAAHWRQYRNPVKLLRERGAALRPLARDYAFVAIYDELMMTFDEYMHAAGTWYTRTFPAYHHDPIAYFCAEFGFHESLPTYCGGLGILAGDHTKSASDLDLPFIGLGLLYKNGYFTQRIDKHGKQLAEYAEFDFNHLPILPLRRRNGQPLHVTVELPGRRVAVKCWAALVGRVQVILLDADISRNKPEDRKLTAQLYGGDRETRLSQEIILGIGGVQALRVLGIAPAIWHLNEGHAAFVCFERLRELLQNKKLNFDHAAEVVAANTVFTTHTPVAAGNEAFSLPLMNKYFRRFCQQSGIELSRLLNLGLQTGDGDYKFFSMPVLALRLSRASNGVSQLHGKISAAMWQHLWPGAPAAESPITAITNGVHADTWMANEMGKLLNRHFGSNWRSKLTAHDFWQLAKQIPDEELWRTRRHLKMCLIDFVRSRLTQQLKRQRAPQKQVQAAAQVLNANALTLGFARRFASYKRADLIFSDIKRLEKLVNDPRRPVQIIFAGKAHPHDRDGQAILRRVYQMTQRPALRDKVILLEDYDMQVGRHLVQGVDVWLNNPRRPMEASGTSGQKAPFNGGINCSILDGWWDEGYNGKNGWTIGEVVEGRSEPEQDRADAAALYEVLEQEVIPCFYERDRHDLPRRWLKIAKASMATLIPQFNTETMLKNYVEKLYVPAMRRGAAFVRDRFAKATAVANLKEQVRANWPFIHVTHAGVQAADKTKRDISAEVYLGALEPEQVQVEVCALFPSQNRDTFEVRRALPMLAVRKNGDGICHYQLSTTARLDRAQQWYIRILPHHPALSHKHEVGLVHWTELK